ncbi:MAG: 3-deoxy-7-phosphoheptulonate synthase [Treponema sp.]|jgi:3-deoxy-7-phosphoheptulonate synthase|nr:3-deoxy-7-phosphoheptulonate synthase [Treponema sp.]
MVIMVRQDVPREKIDHLIGWLEGKSLIVREYAGQERIVLGLIGDTKPIDIDMLNSLDIIESVAEMTDTFKASNRKIHPDDTVISLSPNAIIGGGNFALMAGPCSVESRAQIVSLAEDVKSAGANFLRGGAFKPRTSPYDFQGLGSEGLDLLVEARRITGLPIVTELMDLRSIDLFLEKEIDVIQVGARNTQNYDLLKELGKVKSAILLKRGLAGTIKELLMSAEYIMANGNENVILCERGIRTYEYAYTRNTLDLSAVPVLKSLTHLPVVVDPSHGTGRADLVPSMSLAAAAAGADGIIIEVHNDPPRALSDGAQSLTPQAFFDLVQKIRKVREALA